MIGLDLNFIKKSNKFKIIKDDEVVYFDNYKDSAIYYNANVHNSNYIELVAICGIVGKTICYKSKGDDRE